MPTLLVFHGASPNSTPTPNTDKITKSYKTSGSGSLAAEIQTEHLSHLNTKIGDAKAKIATLQPLVSVISLLSFIMCFTLKQILK